MEIPLESGRKLEKVENITFENVSFQIEERSIFKNLNFSVQEGQNILIQGENGSGKSSLLKMILGFYKPVSYISTEYLWKRMIVKHFIKKFVIYRRKKCC